MNSFFEEDLRFMDCGDGRTDWHTCAPLANQSPSSVLSPWAETSRPLLQLSRTRLRLHMDFSAVGVHVHHCSLSSTHVHSMMQRWHTWKDLDVQSCSWFFSFTLSHDKGWKWLSFLSASSVHLLATVDNWHICKSTQSHTPSLLKRLENHSADVDFEETK